MLNIKKKKEFQILKIAALLKRAPFIGFLSATSFTTQDRIELKKMLQKLNLVPKMVKSSTFLNSLSIVPDLVKLKNSQSLSQGFIILLVPDETKIKISFSILKELNSLLKKKSNLSFLGGYINECSDNNKKGILFNKILIEKISKLTKIEILFSEFLTIITSSQRSFLNSSNQQSRDLSFLLSQKIK